MELPPNSRRPRALTPASCRRRVRRFDVTDSGVVTWNGLDGGGRPVPAGVYFVRMETTEGVTRGKLVRIR
jgi:hypothetical protein